MLKRINELINIVIGVSIGVFIGYGLYSFWDFKSHPELYAMQSASVVYKAYSVGSGDNRNCSDCRYYQIDYP